FKLGKTVDEHADEAACLSVVGSLVGPGRARIEDRGVDAGDSNRHFKAKARIGTELDIVERAVQGRGKQGARRLDRHAVADAIRTSGPSGVDQPAGHAVTGDQI